MITSHLLDVCSFTHLIILTIQKARRLVSFVSSLLLLLEGSICFGSWVFKWGGFVIIVFVGWGIWWIRKTGMDGFY